MPKHRVSPTTEERFLAKTKQSGECLEWTGSTSTEGYGTLRVGGRMVRAHRWVWSQAFGEIPPGLYICHRCDNPRCVTLEHLFLGTPTDNARDREDKRRGNHAVGQATGVYTQPWTRTFGLRNGAYTRPDRLRRGTENGFAKLTPEDILAIRARVAAGETQQVVANAYGVNQPHVSRIVRRTVWAHI